MEAKQGAERAKEIHRLREAENLASHEERFTWLSEDSPCYADGVPVSAHMRHALLAQSRSALMAMAAP